MARRGAVAGAWRFGRVSLYAADVLAMGWWGGPGLGPYAAARRVAFALLAIGLVVPSAVAPRIARAWASGDREARDLIARTLEVLMAAALPATVGLIGTADRWMPRLFGDAYRDGGPWLALIASRLPVVLVSNVQQAALIACRREVWAFRLILGMTVLGGVSIPTMAMTSGPWGVGGAALVVELLGAIGGWLAMGKLGLAPAWHHSIGPSAAGCVGVAGVCWAGRGWPMGGVVIAAMGVYGAIWGVASLRRGPSS
jgi:O-antigen/teichoic acid export membrane protein